MISIQLLKRFYPDEREDGTQAFYGWVRGHLLPSMTLLNLGAGPATGMPVRSFRGEVNRVVGLDVDPVVLENDELDAAHLIREGRFPAADETFDMAVCDFVFEHVQDPVTFLSEVQRTLRRGGSLFFRTPNRWHYVALIARSTPHAFHRLVANRARGLRDAHDPWPTCYRMNGTRRIRRLAQRTGFSGVELRLFEPHPAYLLFHAVPFLLGVAYERVVNRFESLSGLRCNILGRLTK